MVARVPVGAYEHGKRLQQRLLLLVVRVLLDDVDEVLQACSMAYGVPAPFAGVDVDVDVDAAQVAQEMQTVVQAEGSKD